MKASVIIPVFNQKKSIRIVLESLKYQTISKDEYEIIVVDDCSNENIEEEVTRYSNDHDIKYIRHLQNKGVSAVRNTGACKAKNDVLIFSDGDRVLSKNFVSEHIKCHLNNNSIVVGEIVELFADISHVEPDVFIHELFTNKYRRLMRYYNYTECVFNIFNDAGETESNLPWIAFVAGNSSIRKIKYDELNGYDEKFTAWGMENLEFGYRALRNGLKYIFAKKAVSIHIYHTNSRQVSSNIEYFQNKHGLHDILSRYQSFIEGEISLEMLNSVDDAAFLSGGGTYYRRKRLGKPYIGNQEVM